MTLKDIIEKNDSVGGRAFDLAIMVLIIISIISFAIETIPDLSPKIKNTLHILEFIIVMLFSAEYLLRLFYAEKNLDIFLVFME